ncbi:hypothetical protein P378_03055 [Desulforamulus profundi]|uniref:Uncharacterized protein n=1 Tax=Desulforamulus profundi TaxID=1383067 RepID=A0A2C6MDN6_9FIRM|nr:hypothetical protein [Desulforamulus profundi]PHJ39399.1 hypothetical protein P378_03055 [Desulforamulus profundi]
MEITSSGIKFGSTANRTVAKVEMRDLGWQKGEVHQETVSIFQLNMFL